MSWDAIYYRWFLRELLEALRRDLADQGTQVEAVVVVAPRGVTTRHGEDVRRRPHEATLLPRPGTAIVAERSLDGPSYGDGRKWSPPGSHAVDAAVLPPLPNPWLPLPPMHWHSASARAKYQGQEVWMPCWPIVNTPTGWGKAPYYLDPATDDPELPARVRNHQMGTPHYFHMFRPEAFESNRPRASEYRLPRQSRMMRLPWMAGWRNGRTFMRILELPLWWVPELRIRQTFLFTDGVMEGMRFWEPSFPALQGPQYACIDTPYRNDPEQALNFDYNTNVEELHVPSGASLTQTDFPRGVYDAAPNYGFLVFMLNRPAIDPLVREEYAYRNPVARFGLSLSSAYYRVLEVYEDDGEVVDTGHRVLGDRLTGTAGRLVRTIASYPGTNKKRISHVLESDVDGEWRTASRWDHVVYDPLGELSVGAVTVASGGVPFTMAFLRADDGEPMQGRHDATYDDSVIRPFLVRHRIYEGDFGTIPAPGSRYGGAFAGVTLDDRPATLDVVRTRDGGLLATVVNDDDDVTITRQAPGGGDWEVIWAGSVTDLMPTGIDPPLQPAWPNLHHYRWVLPEWPTPVGSLWVRGVPCWWWERTSTDDRGYRSWESPPYGAAGWSGLAPIVVIPNGLPPTRDPLTMRSY